MSILTVDNGGVHYNAGQIWVSHRFVQDEPSDAAEHNIIGSLTQASVCDKREHGKAKARLHLNDVYSGFVCVSIRATKILHGCTVHTAQLSLLY